MAYAQSQRHCQECGRKTLHKRERFSGGMGCLLVILTGGLFLPIWLLIDLLGLARTWHCQRCGQGN